MSLIHPTAVVHPQAQIAPSVEIGPYSVIDAGVRIGERCHIGPHCHLTGQTTLGEGNRVHTGCVLGDWPQDLSYKGAPTELRIGNDNTIREHVTIHRGTKEGSATEIGNNNYLMAQCHVAHNCRIANHTIIVNAVLLGGYAEVEDRAFLGGGAVLHQFCRIGTLAILRGGSRISKDVPPYCMAVENNELVGLNTVGLKRAGLSPDQRSRLKEAYSSLFLGGMNLTQALEDIQSRDKTVEVQRLIDFIQGSRRGICSSRLKPTDLGGE